MRKRLFQCLLLFPHDISKLAIIHTSTNDQTGSQSGMKGMCKISSLLALVMILGGLAAADTPKYFKENHGIGATYIALAVDGTYAVDLPPSSARVMLRHLSG
jgi:hypothetical protein